DYINYLFQLLFHLLERYGLISLDASSESSDVLFREKTFWNYCKQDDADSNRGEHQHNHKPGVPERPGKAHFIASMHPVKRVLVHPVEPSMHAVFFGFQQYGAHHGRRGKRHYKRDHDCSGECHGKLVEKPPDHASHQQDRDKDGYKRNTHGDDSEGDLFSPRQRRLQGGFPHFTVAGYILEDHDG